MAADDRHDLFPNIRRHTVPRRDKLAQAKSVQAVCRQVRVVLAQLSCGVSACGIRDAGAIPAASTDYVINHLIEMIYVYEGRG
jgi:hypothetical protein